MHYTTFLTLAAVAIQKLQIWYICHGSALSLVKF